MRLRDSIGLNFAPFILRLVLGLTFIWAGAGKFFADSSFSPEQTARLAAMGVDVPGGPAASLPLDDDPAGVGTETDAPADESVEDQSAPDESADEDESAETERVTDLAADAYPDGATLRRVYGLALLIDGAAHPGFNADGVEPMAIWPPDAATGKWPVWIALAAGITELLAGVVLLAGFFTRFAALSLVGVMVAAIWLTQIGPAIQAQDALLGFLPNNDLYDIQAWTPLLWQFSLLGSALATMLLGAGAMSLDAIIFSSPPSRIRRKHEGESED
jgi:uncharacterized membrane protein YphA (DoxX/SURF4 family)